MKATKDLAIAALKPITKLGATPNAIAKSLEKKHVTGIQKDENSCPLANYLQNVYGVDYSETEVGGNYIKISGLDIPAKYIPEPVKKFITNFDNAKYPALVE